MRKGQLQELASMRDIGGAKIGHLPLLEDLAHGPLSRDLEGLGSHLKLCSKPFARLLGAHDHAPAAGADRGQGGHGLPATKRLCPKRLRRCSKLLRAP